VGVSLTESELARLPSEVVVRARRPCPPFAGFEIPSRQIAFPGDASTQVKTRSFETLIQREPTAHP